MFSIDPFTAFRDQLAQEQASANARREALMPVVQSQIQQQGLAEAQRRAAEQLRIQQGADEQRRIQAQGAVQKQIDSMPKQPQDEGMLPVGREASPQADNMRISPEPKGFDMRAVVPPGMQQQADDYLTAQNNAVATRAGMSQDETAHRNAVQNALFAMGGQPASSPMGGGVPASSGDFAAAQKGVIDEYGGAQQQAAQKKAGATRALNGAVQSYSATDGSAPAGGSGRLVG